MIRALWNGSGIQPPGILLILPSLFHLITVCTLIRSTVARGYCTRIATFKIEMSGTIIQCGLTASAALSHSGRTVKFSLFRFSWNSCLLLFFINLKSSSVVCLQSFHYEIAVGLRQSPTGEPLPCRYLVSQPFKIQDPCQTHAELLVWRSRITSHLKRMDPGTVFNSESIPEPETPAQPSSSIDPLGSTDKSASVSFSDRDGRQASSSLPGTSGSSTST